VTNILNVRKFVYVVHLRRSRRLLAMSISCSPVIKNLAKLRREITIFYRAFINN